MAQATAVRLSLPVSMENKTLCSEMWLMYHKGARTKEMIPPYCQLEFSGSRATVSLTLNYCPPLRHPDFPQESRSDAPTLCRYLHARVSEHIPYRVLCTK